MDEELKSIEEDIKQFYDVKNWTEQKETQNFFQFLEKSKIAFIERLSIEKNIQQIRCYQGMIQMLSLLLVYPESAMAAGELAEQQKIERSKLNGE